LRRLQLPHQILALDQFAALVLQLDTSVSSDVVNMMLGHVSVPLPPVILVITSGAHLTIARAFPENLTPPAGTRPDPVALGRGRSLLANAETFLKPKKP
jgi:hypothetical protein